MLPALTLLHFCVDGVCGAVLAAYALDEPAYDAVVFHFMLYNVIAFGGQWLAGLVLDCRTRWTGRALACSTLLLGLAMISPLGIWARTILLGLGNCIFHVAGGSLVLRGYSHTFRQLGIFVSSGAVGLALGLNYFLPACCFWFVDLAGTLWLLHSIRQAGGQWGATVAGCISRSATADRTASRWPVILAIFVLLACVVLRGFGGSGFPGAPVLLFPLVFAAGKVLGGIVCDCCGYRRTVLLIFLAGCLALQMPDSLWGAMLLALAFNMTMPLTLRLLHWARPSSPGLMFGLAAGCLLPGAFLVLWFYLPPVAMLAIQFMALLLAWRLLPISVKDGCSRNTIEPEACGNPVSPAA